MSHAVYARALPCRRRSTDLRAQPLCLRPSGRTRRFSWRQRKARVGRHHFFNSDDVAQSSLDRLRRLAARQRRVPHLMPTVTDNLTGIGAATPRARPFYTEIIL